MPHGLGVAISDGVAELTLERPPLNVLDTALLGELAATVRSLPAQPDLRLIVLRGAGKAFSAGVDVGEHLGPRLDAMLDAFLRAALSLAESEIPTLAVAHGALLGGACELVALADLAIVADDAVVGCPEIRLGVVPPVAAALFPRLLGTQRAAALILTGETVSGAEAARMGLVWKSVPPERLEAEAGAVIERLRGLSAPALRLARRTVRESAGRPLARALAEATELQKRAIPELADAQEGLRSFLERRTAVWVHR